MFTKEQILENIVAIGRPYGGAAGFSEIRNIPPTMVEKAKKYTLSHRKGIIVCCLPQDRPPLEPLLREVKGMVWCSQPELQYIVETIHPFYRLLYVAGYTKEPPMGSIVVDRDSYPIMARHIKIAALETAILPTNILEG